MTQKQPMTLEGNKEFDEVQTLFNTDWVWAEPARFAARFLPPVIAQPGLCIFIMVMSPPACGGCVMATVTGKFLCI